MLILILIYVQYSQIAMFSFEKGSNDQINSLDFHHPTKKFPLENFPPPCYEGFPHPLTLFKKPCCLINLDHRAFRSGKNYMETLYGVEIWKFNEGLCLCLCDVLCDLVQFVQFKKFLHSPWRSVTFSLQLC